MLSKIIPNYILINGIAIGGTVFVILLVYRKLSSSFPKRLTAYFERFYCGDRARSTPPKLRAGACHCKTHRGTPRGRGRCIVTGTGTVRPSVSQIKEKAPLLPKVQTGNAHQHKKFTDNHHPKAKTLIKLCKPPIICRHIWIISALAGQIPMAQQQRRTRRCSSTVPI